MHDIKFIRNNPQEFQRLMEKRSLKIELQEIIELDNLIRAYQTDLQEIQQKRQNQLNIEREQEIEREKLEKMTFINIIKKK